MNSRATAVALALCLAACSAAPGVAIDGPSADAPRVDDARAIDAPPGRGLGLNDVTVLVPLPTAIDQPVLTTIAGVDQPLVSHFLVAALVDPDIGAKNGLPIAYRDYQVVGVRFDLCARRGPGPCPATADGELRLVLQPLYVNATGVFAHDVGLHAFYPVPHAELGEVVRELRALAALADVPLEARLTVSPALTAATPPAGYRDRLRALILRYARMERLARLTVLGQEATSAAFAWIMRGGDVVDGRLQLTPIPTLDGANKQTALLAGGDVIFNPNLVADAPAGFATAINGASFGAATPAERAQALAALVEVDNPTRHDPSTAQCLACHVATHLTARRAAELAVDPAALPGAYTSSFDLTAASIAATDPRVLRGLGWAGNLPAISQRVVNDTAAELPELEARFPR